MTPRKPFSKDRENTRIPTLPVGSTDVAGMGKNKRVSDPSKRNAENLISSTLARMQGLGPSGSMLQILESLIWPFVARRSRSENWFTDKELGRFRASISATARTLISLESVDNKEQTFIKFWLDSYLCQVFLDPQRPVREEWMTKPLFTGWCRRFIARSVAKRDVAFLYSLQKGSKQMWPRLGKVMERVAYEKHRSRLSSQKGSIPEDLQKTLFRESLNIFGDCSSETPTKLLPSGSACLQAPVRDNGALSLFERFHYPSDEDAAIVGKLPSLHYAISAWRNSTYMEAYAKASEKMVLGPEFKEWKINPTENLSIVANEVRIMALPEPGKFRILSLGDGHLYTALQPLQGLLLSAWKRDPASTMVPGSHEMLSSERGGLGQDLTAKVRKIDEEVYFFGKWCSGDYEAATDLLKKDATLTVMHAVSHVRGSRLAEASMFNVTAVYPAGTVAEEEVRVVCPEGQLMGHPLSFPLLCAINKAVYLTAVGRWVNKRPKERMARGEILAHNVLVNGDDILFKSDDEFFKIFIEVAAGAGFKASQGKNYLSPDCCMINSQVYRRVGGKMKRFGYLNLRLVKGTGLKNGESGAVPTQIGKDLGQMGLLTPWTTCSFPAAFSRWNQDWFGKTYYPNWYLPVHLGGFGVPGRLAPAAMKITRSQRLMAARFVNDPAMALYRRAGLSLPVAKYAQALAKYRMKPSGYIPESGEVEADEDPWLARIAFADRASMGSVVEIIERQPKSKTSKTQTVKVCQNGKKYSDAVFVNRFKPEYRLKPMSKEMLIRYWDAKVYAFGLPACPPLNRISVQDIPTQKFQELEQANGRNWFSNAFMRGQAVQQNIDKIQFFANPTKLTRFQAWKKRRFQRQSFLKAGIEFLMS